MIKPVNRAGDYLTGCLSENLKVKDIVKVLGFKANIQDDESKVKYSWGFEYNGVRCGIWDYKGHRWSTFGPREVFEKLFPGNVT